MVSPKPQWCSEGKEIHKFTTEENSLKLFQPDGERSVTSHSSGILRNLLVSEAISNSLKSLLSFPSVTRPCPDRHQTGFVSEGLSAELMGGHQGLPGRVSP